MSGRFQIAIVLFMLVEAIVLGAGVFAVFTTSLQAHAAHVMPVILIAGTALAAALSWMTAPALDTRIPSYSTVSSCRIA